MKLFSYERSEIKGDSKLYYDCDGLAAVIDYYEMELITDGVTKAIKVTPDLFTCAASEPSDRLATSCYYCTLKESIGSLAAGTVVPIIEEDFDTLTWTGFSTEWAKQLFVIPFEIEIK